MSETPTYFSDWTHPQIAEWNAADAAIPPDPEDEDFDRMTAALKKAERDMKQYRYDHETLPRMERRPHEDKLHDMANLTREMYQNLWARFPSGRPNRRWYALELRKSQRAADETPLSDAISALQELDKYLLALDVEEGRLAKLTHALEEKLAGARAQQANTRLSVEDARREFQDRAATIGFTGQPTVDNPARPTRERFVTVGYEVAAHPVQVPVAA